MSAAHLKVLARVVNGVDVLAIGGLLAAVGLFHQPSALLIIAAPCTLLAAAAQLAANRAEDNAAADASFIRGLEQWERERGDR